MIFLTHAQSLVAGKVRTRQSHSTRVLQYSSSLQRDDSLLRSILPRLGQDRIELFQLDRLGQEQIHPAGERLFLRRGVAQASDGDDHRTRAAASLLKAADGARSFEAVHDGHVNVHEHDLRLGDRGVLVVFGGLWIIGALCCLRGILVHLNGFLAVARDAVVVAGFFGEDL